MQMLAVIHQWYCLYVPKAFQWLVKTCDVKQEWLNSLNGLACWLCDVFSPLADPNGP